LFVEHVTAAAVVISRHICLAARGRAKLWDCGAVVCGYVSAAVCYCWTHC